MSLHRKLNVKIFLMFIVAENTGSVNISEYKLNKIVFTLRRKKKKLDLSLALRFCHRSDGRYGFEKNISNCTVSYTALPMKNDLHFSTNTVLSTKFPTDFNSTLLCFPTNCWKCCYIDTLFFNMCHTLKTRLNTQIPMLMCFVDLYKGQVSLASRLSWLCFTRNETKVHWQSKFLLSLSLQVVLYLSGVFFW